MKQNERERGEENFLPIFLILFFSLSPLISLYFFLSLSLSYFGEQKWASFHSIQPTIPPTKTKKRERKPFIHFSSFYSVLCVQYVLGSEFCNNVRAKEIEWKECNRHFYVFCHPLSTATLLFRTHNKHIFIIASTFSPRLRIALWFSWFS
jgi:hypothetical protein